MELQDKKSLINTDDRNYWIRLDHWLAKLGISSVTGWRWRKKGWLNTVKVGGRLFLRPKDLAEFERRAEMGEFKVSRRTSNS